MLIKTNYVKMKELVFVRQLVQLAAYSEMVILFYCQVKFSLGVTELHDISVALTQIHIVNSISDMNKRLIIVGDGTYLFGFVF